MTAHPTSENAVLRRLRVGPALLRIRRALNFGIRAEVSTFIAKRRYLRKIAFAKPLESAVGTIDCFMLLNEVRLWEGMWALYSFRSYYGPCRIVILDDGTLTEESRRLLVGLFPGITIPQVADHDMMVFTRLRELGLSRCLAWRERFVFFRKLIDPCLMEGGTGAVFLDSDVLHFEVPNEIRLWTENPNRILFIADVARYSLSGPHDTLSEICGATIPECFCAGYLCIPKGALQLQHVEDYLTDPCFDSQLECGKFSHVAEQSLHAMEAARVGCEVLPRSYATCPDVPSTKAVAGHFCGGAVMRTWFYTKGLPVLSHHFGLTTK
jgi:hypothetical protein